MPWCSCFLESSPDLASCKIKGEIYIPTYVIPVRFSGFQRHHNRHLYQRLETCIRFRFESVRLFPVRHWKGHSALAQVTGVKRSAGAGEEIRSGRLVSIIHHPCMLRDCVRAGRDNGARIIHCVSVCVCVTLKLGIPS